MRIGNAIASVQLVGNYDDRLYVKHYGDGSYTLHIEGNHDVCVNLTQDEIDCLCSQLSKWLHIGINLYAADEVYWQGEHYFVVHEPFNNNRYMIRSKANGGRATYGWSSGPEVAIRVAEMLDANFSEGGDNVN